MHKKLLLRTFTVLGLSAATANAVDGVWTFTGSPGDWGNTANWLDGNIATGAGALADFTQIDIGATRTVNLDTSRIIGRLLIGDNDGDEIYNIAPVSGSTLTFNNNGATALLTQAAVSDINTVSVPLVLVDALQVSNLGSVSDLSITGGVTGSADLTLMANDLAAIRFATGAININGRIFNRGTGTNESTLNVVIDTNVQGVVQDSATSTLSLQGVNTFTTGSLVRAGTLRLRNASGGGAGALTLGDLNSTADTAIRFDIGTNAGATYANNIVVQAGWSGTRLLANTNTADNGHVTLNGSITLRGAEVIFANSKNQFNITSAFSGEGSIATTLGNTVAPGVMTFSGTVGSGITRITHAGPGTFSLTSENPGFAGLIDVRSGSFNPSGNAALGASTVVAVGAAGTFVRSGSNPGTGIGGLTDGVGGGGTVTSGGSSRLLRLSANADYSFGGVIQQGTTLSLVKAGIGTQSLSGTSIYTGSTAIHGGTVRLQGAGGAMTSTSGTTINYGSALVLDNSTAANANRLNDAAPVTFNGGGISLIGHASTDVTENIGAISTNAGVTTIAVAHNGSAGGTTLAINDSGSLRDSTAGVVNFVGTGGTLGAAGAAPRITFAGALNTNTTNGMLASAASSATTQTIGWGTVNGTSWAGVGANGIVALADTARDSATLGSAAVWEMVGFAPSTTVTTLSANLGSSSSNSLGALKISPTAAGQSLAMGAFNIFSPAVMLTGTQDFTITATTGSITIGGNNRYLYVNEAGTILDYNGVFSSSGALNKAGAGFLSLSSTTIMQIPTPVNILAGTLRATLTSLGGGAASGGASTTISLRGGVLEINGGGTLTRAVDLAATASGGSISFESNSSSNLGGGGFSAVNGAATVTLVDTIGGATPKNLVWGDNVFLSDGAPLIMGSTKSDSRITFTNNIGLDTGAASLISLNREFRVIDNASLTTDTTRLTGVISGSASAELLKTGSGVLELTNTNTYAGATVIAEGTLALVGGGSIASSNRIMVGDLASRSSARFDVTATTAGGITLGAAQSLTGYGAVRGNVTGVAGTRVAPGGNPLASIGTLGIENGNFTLGGGSLVVELGALGNNDRVVVSGTGTASDGTSAVDVAGSNLVVTGGTNLQVGDIIYVLSNSGVDGIAGNFTSLAGASNALTQGALFNVGVYEMQISYQAVDGSAFTGGNDLAFRVNAVPEPGTLSVLGLSAVGLMARRRRRA